MRYRFHAFELLPSPPFLIRNGEPVPVSSQVLLVLRTLVERRGELVSKSELALAVWGHEHQSEAALARAVMRTRRLLGDDGEEQRFIRTVHGRGLMFVAPVEAIEQVSRPTDRPQEPADSSTPGRLSLSFGLAVTAVLAVLLTAGLAWRWAATPVVESPGAPAPAPSERVVVLAKLHAPVDDDDAATLAATLPLTLSRGLAPLGMRLIHAAEPAMPIDPEEFDRFSSEASALSQVDARLRIVIERQATGLSARLEFEGTAPGALVLPAAEPAQLAAHVERTVQARLSGQGDVDLQRLDIDPVLAELDLRANAAWARGDGPAALRAIEAGLALSPGYWPLKLLQIEVELSTNKRRAANGILQLLDSVTAGNTPLQRAMLLQRAGVATWYAGDAAGAQHLLEAALEAAGRANAPLTEALSRNALSMALQSQGAIEAAWNHADLAVGALRRHPLPLSFALSNLAYLAEERGRLDRASALHAEALALRRSFGADRLVAASLYGLARIERRQGRLLEAQTRALEADQAMQALGQQLDRVSVLEELAVIARLQGALDEADEHLDAAEALARSVDDTLGQAWILDSRARIRIERGEVTAAIPMLRRSIAEQRAHGELNEARYTEIVLLDALWQTDAPDADALANELSKAVESLSHDQKAALATVELRHHRRLGLHAQAEAHCEHALAIARASGALDHEAQAALECALLHRSLGRGDEAETFAALARNWSPHWRAAQVQLGEHRP